MRRVLDGVAAIPGAVVAGDLLALTEHAHGQVVGADVDGLADVAGGAPSSCWSRDGLGLLADDAREDDIDVEGALAMRAGAWFDEEPIARALAGGGVKTHVGGLVPPLGRLRAEILQ